MAAEAVPAQVTDTLPATPPPLGLLNAAVVTDADKDSPWGNGLTWLPEGCESPADPYWWECPEGDGVTPVTAYESTGGAADGAKDPASSPAVQRVRPFTIYDTVSCTAMQFRAEDWQARARRALNAHLGAALELEVWDGQVAQAAGFPNPYLNNSPTIGNGGAALGFSAALAELEQMIADQGGGPAMIHAQPRTVSLWTQDGQVFPEGNGRRLRTSLGNLVVSGVGYPGTGPTLDPNEPGPLSAYAYITPIVRVWLGPVNLLTLEDNTGYGDADIVTSTNDLIVRAERIVAYGWDPCIEGGILVDHTTEYATAPVA